MNWTPGPLSSILIKTENAVPNNPENRAKIKYNDPMSLALVDRNHLSFHIEIEERLGSDSFVTLYTWLTLSSTK